VSNNEDCNVKHIFLTHERLKENKLITALLQKTLLFTEDSHYQVCNSCVRSYCSVDIHVKESLCWLLQDRETAGNDVCMTRWPHGLSRRELLLYISLHVLLLSNGSLLINAQRVLKAMGWRGRINNSNS